MGVHGLTAILKKYAPNSVRTVSCNAFSQQTIAIDASCHLNKFIYGSESHPQRHIYGFYQLAQFCSLNAITPLFVFDGPQRLEAKQLEHAKRARSRKKVKHSLLFEREQSLRLDNWLQVSDQYDQAQMSKESALAILGELGETLKEMEADPTILEDGTMPVDIQEQELQSKLRSIAQELQQAIATAEDTEKYTRTVRNLANRERDLMADMIIHRYKDIKSALQQLKKENQAMLSSLEKRSFRITQHTRDECQDFLKTLGYVCLSCDNHEAEAMCANLAKSGRTTATVSEDLDTIVFGDVPILRHFFSKGRPILSIDPVIARQDLGFTRESFIDLCILCGTDFSGTIQGIGPHKALQAIQRYGSIERVLNNLDSRYVPQETFDYSLARHVFNDLPDIPTHELSYEPPATDKLAISNILQHYQIDPLEADLAVRQAIIQQSIIDVKNWGSDPFSSAFAANKTVDPKLLQVASS
ncbi:uncharacterized protein ATC70_007060 [Mucor velutinosus]|uniref:PIN domain-like protein n=1 Tax=Mucor velutinosus TaxID=708070 RepID=A0AAN7D480_9FUNG|nr:hypothetical protein ATC70_007060 [Mucor velutinosus]